MLGGFRGSKTFQDFFGLSNAGLCGDGVGYPYT